MVLCVARIKKTSRCATVFGMMTSSCSQQTVYGEFVSNFLEPKIHKPGENESANDLGKNDASTDKLEDKNKEQNLYLAKLAEKVERYDEMADYMQKAAKMTLGKLSEEERELLHEAYRHAVGERGASLRMLSNNHVENIKSKSSTNEAAHLVADYRKKIEKEHDALCQTILGLVEKHCLTSNELDKKSRAFYYMMKGQYNAYLAQFKVDEKQKKHFEATAKDAFDEGMKIVEDKEFVSNPSYVTLALKASVFYYETLKQREIALEIARKAYEDGKAQLDSGNVSEDSYKTYNLTVQSLRDNLTLLDDEAAEETKGDVVIVGDKKEAPGGNEDEKNSPEIFHCGGCGNSNTSSTTTPFYEKKSYNMDDKRDQNVYMVKLAQLTDRSDDVASYMRELAIMAGGELSEKERDFLVFAHDKVIQSRRDALVTLSSVESVERNTTSNTSNRADLVADYRKKIEIEYDELCKKVLDLLENHLIVRSGPDKKLRSFYYMMMGQYNLHRSEFKVDLKEKNELDTLAKDAFDTGMKMGEDLPVTNTIHLGMVHNASVFYFDTLKQPEKAKEMASKAYTDGKAHLKNLCEDCPDKYDLIRTLQSLHSHLDLWGFELKA